MPSHVDILLPQISWHAKEPIQSVDASAAAGLVATAGNDNEVRLWRLSKVDSSPTFVQTLSGHSKVVNVVRFCPLGVTLASAGDDSLIMLWRERANRSAGFGEAAPANGATNWGPVCALRGHCEDVYDLCWAPRADALFSGGVDGTTIVWNIAKAKPAQVVRDHENYVQGVAWDPADEFVVSVSLDRTARVYSAKAGAAATKKSGKQSTFGGAPAAGDDALRDMVCHTVIEKRTQTFTLMSKATAGSAAATANAGSGSSGAVASATPAAKAPLPPDADADGVSTPPIASKAAVATSASASASTLAATAHTTAAASGASGIRSARKVDLFLEQIPSFYRRPAWSPDGSFLLIPCGQYFREQPPPAGVPEPTTYVFAREQLSTPCAHLPSPDKPVIAIRFCPVLYQRKSPPKDEGGGEAAKGEGGGGGGADGGEARPTAGAAEWMGRLPYRMLWAVATLNSIVVYDSASDVPILIASDIHYDSLTDVTWMPDGWARAGARTPEMGTRRSSHAAGRLLYPHVARRLLYPHAALLAGVPARRTAGWRARTPHCWLACPHAALLAGVPARPTAGWRARTPHC